jgi:hypothetical protein
VAEAPVRSSALFAGIIFLIGVVGAGFTFWWLSARARERRLQNDKSTSASLWMLSKAEGDFRENDRDGNGIKDYWTGDVAGLYRFGLIERSVAEADTCPLAPLVSRPIPKNGYYFKALRMDRSEFPPVVYAQATDKTSGKVHHQERFGFCAYPAEPGVTGNEIFIVNENHTVFRTSVGKMPIPQDWPSDNEIVRFWTKFFLK